MVNGPRRICAVTGTRAEYGLLYWLLHEIRQDPELHLQLVACAAHLCAEHGMTVEQIEADGFTIDARVEMLLAGDGNAAMAKSTGLGWGSPSPTSTAARSRPVPWTTASAMPSPRWRHYTSPRPRHSGGASFRWENHPTGYSTWGHPGSPLFLVTIHPVTRGPEDSRTMVNELCRALEAFPEARVIWTFPNADAGGQTLRRIIERWAADRSHRVLLTPSLGQQRYLSALKLADVVIGNSSSGIIEAPAAGTPTVNIGSRQEGRPLAPSIISCKAERESIAAAIVRASTDGFRRQARQADPPYGRGHSSRTTGTRTLGVFPMDSRICQTFAVSPAEPGDFPLLVNAELRLNPGYAAAITTTPGWRNFPR